MGCFGTSGFLSRLPILSGQRVVCFIASVHSDASIRETYYPDSVVAPYCLPIHGKYDDYGCIKNIVRDANVEVIEKYFGCEIDKILKGVERLLYGRTIKENIEYWSKDEDDWHKQEAQQYKNIVPLENGLDKLGFNKNRTYQWTLLFEHENIYNNVAEMYGPDKLEDCCNNAINTFMDVTKRYKDLYNKYKNSEVYDAKFEHVFLKDMPNMFKRRYFGSDIGCFSDYLEDLLDGGIGDAKKEKIKEMIDMSQEIGKIYNDSRRNILCLNHEGTSESFMAIFKQVDIDSRFKLYLDCEDEIRKFYSIWWFCNSIPMHFGLSHTGSQEYDEDLFKKFNIVINNVIDKEFSEYSSETTINTSYLVGRELENGTVEYQKNSLGGFTFSPYIDGDTCRWKTKSEASDEIDRYKELDGCLLWQLDEIKVVKPIDY